MKAERDRYKETMKILSNVKLRMNEKVKMAERQILESHSDFEKTLEEYDALHANLENRISMYQRNHVLMKDENKKLRDDLKIFKLYIMVLIVSVMLMFYCVAISVGGTKKMFPSS